MGGCLFSLYIYTENFIKILSETTGRISLLPGRNISLVTLYQDCSSHHDSSKDMAARGQGLFTQYICIENFKTLSVRNHWIDFNIIHQKCFCGDSPPSLLKPWWFVKNMAARGQGLLSLYIYIENFKNHLVRNHWTNFNIILQKYFFVDPLPRLFKPFWFVKNHGHQGAGLIFPLYRKF